MAIFFDLRRQGATAGYIAVAVEDADAFFQYGLAESIPFHCRVARREILAHEFAIFDIQKRLHEHGRNLFVARINSRRRLVLIQRRARCVEQGDAALIFFAVGQK